MSWCKKSVRWCLSSCKATATGDAGAGPFAWDENTKRVHWWEGAGWYGTGKRSALITRNKKARFQTFSHQKSGHNKHLSEEEGKVFQHRLSGEREGSRAAAGDVSSHCLSPALFPEVRSSSKFPFQAKISPPLEAVPPDL